MHAFVVVIFETFRFILSISFFTEITDIFKIPPQI